VTNIKITNILVTKSVVFKRGIKSKIPINNTVDIKIKVGKDIAISATIIFLIRSYPL